MQASHADNVEQATPTQEFTYPLSLLYDFPQLPPNDVVEALQQSFDELFQAHPFLNALPIPSPSQDPVNPFFRYSLACLVSAAAAPPQQGQPIPNQTAQDLFLAGTSLWNVMLEVDNREARTLEGVLSVSCTLTHQPGQCIVIAERAYSQYFYQCTHF